MKIMTTQVSGEDALRAVADGKSVQMIWMNDGRPFFSDFTAKIKDAMALGEAFLIVETAEDEPTDIEAADKVLSEAMVKTGVSVEDFNAKMKEHSKAITFETEGKIVDSQQKIADTCENAAEEAKPSVLENFKPLEVKKRNRNVKKLDDGKIIALYNANWSVKKIADEMGVGDKAIYAHLKALREEGKL